MRPCTIKSFIHTNSVPPIPTQHPGTLLFFPCYIFVHFFSGSWKLDPIIFNICTYLLRVAHPPTTKASLPPLCPLPVLLPLVLGCLACQRLCLVSFIISFLSLQLTALCGFPTKLSMALCNSPDSLPSHCVLGPMLVPLFWEGKERGGKGRENIGMKKEAKIKIVYTFLNCSPQKLYPFLCSPAWYEGAIFPTPLLTRNVIHLFRCGQSAHTSLLSL